MKEEKDVARLVVFDLDGVLVAGISSWVMVHDHFDVDNDVAYYAFCDGKIDDEEFMRRDVALWLQFGEQHIDDITAILDAVPLTKGAKKVLKYFQNRGYETAVISGGIDILADRVGRELGIDLVLSNGVEADTKGFLTGEGILRVSLRDKATPMKEIIDSMDIEPEFIVAVGNSNIDIPMFELADLSIGFNPDDEETRLKADHVVESDDLSDILKHVP